MIWSHVSELAVDRLLAGELHAADAAAVRDHASTCATCRTRLDDAVATQREFAAERPRLGLPVPLARRRKLGRSVAIVVPLVAVAAAALLVLLPRDRAVVAHDEVRTKGTSIVGFFVAHGDQMRRGGVRESVMPGDRIQIVTTTLQPTWFAAISDDASGTRSVYVEPTKLDVGRDRPAPLAIELDATLGDETVTALFCPTAFELDAIDLDALPEGCSVDRFTLVKVPK